MMLDYLLSGRLPPGRTVPDMEWLREEEFGGMDAAALGAAIQRHLTEIEEAEALIAEARVLRPTRAPPGGSA